MANDAVNPGDSILIKFIKLLKFLPFSFFIIKSRNLDSGFCNFGLMPEKSGLS